MRIRKPFIVAFVFILLLFFLSIMPLSLSKYETSSTGEVENLVAYYILETTYSTDTLSLPPLVPSGEAYAFNFTVANNDGINRTETNLEYDLTLRTTTNLPIEYGLYLNQDYNDVNSQDIITSESFVQDEDGTFFRVLTTPRQYFSYLQNEINTYTLIAYFPMEYTDEIFHDLVDAIEITIESRQVID